MNENFTKMTQLIIGGITNDILQQELEIESIINSEVINVSDKIRLVRENLKKMVVLELELKKLTTMITIK